MDTSVAIAWYLPESFSPAAREWQRRMVEGHVRLIVPSLQYWEFANVLRSYVNRGEIPAETATRTYELHLEAPLSVIDPMRESILDRALEFDATVYDAVFVSLALEMDCRLLTAERTTTPWVLKLGKRVQTLS